MALDLGKKKPVAEPVEEKQTVVTEATAPAEAEGICGSKRNSIAFVCPLGDPSTPDTTKVKKEDGTEERKVTSTICGYRFKALEDVRVPDCGTTEAFKGDAMNYKTLDNWKDVKAGEEFCLTPFETAYMLSHPEYNGGCDGGEKPVYCVYQSKVAKSKTGVAVSTSASQTPRVSLRATVGSIKDFDIEDVLTFVREEVNGVVRKRRTIKPGFEKWAPLAIQAQRKATGSREAKAIADPTKVINKNAQQFLNYVKSRNAQ